MIFSVIVYIANRDGIFMKKNIKYWDSKLHIGKLRELMKIMMVNQNNYLTGIVLNNISINRKLYNITNNSSLKIKCSDGRNMSIVLNCIPLDFLIVEPQISYVINDGCLFINGDTFEKTYVNLNNDFQNHFVCFDDFYNDEQMIKKINYCFRNEKNKTNLFFNDSDKFIYTFFDGKNFIKRYFNINNQGYVTYNDGFNNEWVVSLSDEKIISYNGVELNLVDEKEVLDKYANFYELELHIYRKALQERNEFLNSLDVYTFTEDELGMIINLLKEEMIARINKDTEKAVVKKKSLNR